MFYELKHKTSSLAHGCKQHKTAHCIHVDLFRPSNSDNYDLKLCI